jgi:hypothetical protein
VIVLGIGLMFIKRSLPFLKYENLWEIKNKINDCTDKDKEKIIKLVDKEIAKRDKKLVVKVELEGGKEVWLPKKK